MPDERVQTLIIFGGGFPFPDLTDDNMFHVPLFKLVSINHCKVEALLGAQN